MGLGYRGGASGDPRASWTPGSQGLGLMGPMDILGWASGDPWASEDPWASGDPWSSGPWAQGPKGGDHAMGVPTFLRAWLLGIHLYIRIDFCARFARENPSKNKKEL